MRISTRISLLGVVTVFLVGTVNLAVGMWSLREDHSRLIQRQLERFEPILRDAIDSEHAILEARLTGLAQDPTVRWVVETDLDDASIRQAAARLRSASDAEIVAIFEGEQVLWTSPPDADLGGAGTIEIVGTLPHVVARVDVGSRTLVATRPLDANLLGACREKSDTEVILAHGSRVIVSTTSAEAADAIMGGGGGWTLRPVEIGPLRAIGAVRASTGNAEYQRTVQRLLLTGVVSVLAVAGLFLWATSRIIRPLDQITRGVQQLARGELEAPPTLSRGADEVRRLNTGVRTLVERLTRVSDRLDAVGRGDLATTIDDEGHLTDALRRMVGNQRELVAQIVHTASEIDEVARRMSDTAYTLEEGAAVQSSVVEETLRTLETLLASATRVSEASRTVQSDAEETFKNHEHIETQIEALTGHTERIGSVLDVIRDIAARAEMLALNAALEGTRAGRAGRGFSLVATEMQTLTESISAAVRDIKQLTLDIQSATTATVSAVEAGRRRSESSAQSAKQITMTIQQQRSGTEQVTVSMSEISRVIAQANEASQDGAGASERLVQLAKRLQRLVGHFDV